MTRIDFYVLKTGKFNLQEHFACQLAEKIYKSGHQLLIHTESQNSARNLDNMLWTFRDCGFIPHALYQKSHNAIEPVIISHFDDIDSHSDVMLNMAQQVPSFFSRFQRVTEIVNNDPNDKETARARFKFYRDRGYQIVTHDV